jgi:diaminopimelate decarboxylase
MRESTVLWPVTADRDQNGRLVLAGIPVTKLAETYGTPLYVYDEATIRAQCRTYRSAFEERYPSSRVVYAGKAYLSTALLEIIHEEGLWLDVVSGGEMYFAVRSGFPPERIAFHGNNKSEPELRLALEMGIGQIVIDNEHEIDLLSRLLPVGDRAVRALIRLNPGIDTHTHDYRKTGIVDSKFGLLIETGDAERAVERALRVPGLQIDGYHIHLGSQLFEMEPYVAAVDTLFDFAAAMGQRFGVIPREISPGGGLGIQYESSDPEARVDDFAQAISDAAMRGAERLGIVPPVLVVEPGRSIVGPAGVAIYRVGSIKEIPGIRRYVCVDGGMADNIRPPLYQARYEATLANRADQHDAIVTIAGKYCESGDVLITDARIGAPEPGDLIAIAAAGAYCLAMASNYNLALRPPALLVADGDTRVMQRRETYEDLLARESGFSAVEAAR